MTPDSLLLPVQSPLGAGTVRDIVGSGSIGTVYVIHRSDLGVERAVKVLRPGFPPHIQQLLEAELKIPAQFDHPSFARIYGTGNWQGSPFIEMEHIQGPALDKLFVRLQPLPLELCTAIGIRLCEAIGYLHQFEYMVKAGEFCSLLHLNLKPSNLFLTPEGGIKLTDAGPVIASVNLSGNNGNPQSLRYAAPELRATGTATASADIYSVAVLLLDMLFARDRAESDKGPAHAKRTRDAKLPRKLLRALGTCIRPNPEQRTVSIEELRERLTAVHRRTTRSSPQEVIAEFLSKGSVSARRGGGRGPRLGLLTASALVAAGTLSAGILLVLPWHSAAPTIPQPQSQTAVQSVGDPPPLSGSEDAPQQVPAPDSSGNAAVSLAVPVAGHVGSVRQIRSPLRPHDRSSTSFLADLRNEYATSDLTAILAAEVSKRRYANALRVCDSMSPAQLKLVPVAINKLRALQGSKKIGLLHQFLGTIDVNDAEFYLAKAQYLSEKGNVSEALAVLKQCRSSPSLLSDKKMIEGNATYCEAVCFSTRYDKVPSEENRLAVLDKWFAVKFAFRDQQTHACFQEANLRIRRYSKGEPESDQ